MLFVRSIIQVILGRLQDLPSIFPSISCRSGSDLDCFSDVSVEPPAIAVYTPDVLGVYLVFITSHMMASRGDESF